jgi:PAS domain S-box-containing protein
MAANVVKERTGERERSAVSLADTQPYTLPEAEKALEQLAEVFLQEQGSFPGSTSDLSFAYGQQSDAATGFESPVLNLEARYRALVEQIPAVVFMAYLDKGIGEAYVSPQIEATLGFSQSEWLEDPVRWYQQIHPDDKARWSVEAAAMFLSGKPLRSAYRVIARDGRVLWFQCEAKMIRRPDGRPWFIHGVGFDITDLKVTEAALRRSEELFRLLVSGVKDYAIVMLDTEGRITSWNTGAEQILGHREREILGRHFSEFYTDDGMRQGKASLGLTTAAEKGRYEDAGWRRRKDGSLFWADVVITAVRDETGKLRGFGKVTRDITDRKLAEDALEEERSVLSAILDTVGALVAVLDPEGRIIRFNRFWSETTGYAAGQIEGRPIWDLFPLSEDIEHFREIFALVKDGQQVRETESLWVTPDDESHCISWTFTVLRRPDGATSHIVATGVDVTERRKMEQTVLEVSAREQRRIGQDLHDGLGQHLTGIAFLSKVLAQGLSERSYVEAKEAEKIVRLVNQAIEKTRELAHGLLPVVSEGHGLMSALERWSDQVQDVCRIECRFVCESQVLIDDVSVATHLYHIAQEAVNNAIKHGKARAIIIRLAADGNSGTLIVDDDGLGYKGASSKHRGLGLGIMSHRANMMGGSLDIRSLTPAGTRVTCIFPMRRSAELREVADADARPVQSITTKQDFSH